jgi:hypothetical protein
LTWRDRRPLAGASGGALTRQTVGQFVFDVADHVAVTATVAAADIEQHEAVERVAVARGVNLGIHDVETGAAEKADHAGKQIALVEGVGHDFDAVAVRVDAGLDDRFPGCRYGSAGAGMPGDFFC